MNTDTLRTLTAEACSRMGGKLWPNGLGFDLKRWEYCYSEAYGKWQAHTRPGGRYSLEPANRVGWGSTPEEARAGARPGGSRDGSGGGLMAATLTKRVPVTLTVEETNAVLEALKAYSGSNFEHARKTKSARIRAYCLRVAETARDLEAAIVRRMCARVEVPEVRQTACRHCGQDIEGFRPFPAGEWRDRGNNRTCPDGSGRKHAPTPNRRRSR